MCIYIYVCVREREKGREQRREEIRQDSKEIFDPPPMGHSLISYHKRFVANLIP